MIEPEKMALAQVLYQLKLGNPQGWQAICKALQELSDPEHKRFVAASVDNIQRAQGRVQMITEVLEVFFRCEEMVNPVPRARAPAMSLPAMGWLSGTAKGQVNNG